MIYLISLITMISPWRATKLILFQEGVRIQNSKLKIQNWYGFEQPIQNFEYMWASWREARHRAIATSPAMQMPSHFGLSLLSLAGDTAM